MPEAKASNIVEAPELEDSMKHWHLVDKPFHFETSYELNWVTPSSQSSLEFSFAEWGGTEELKVDHV